MRRWMMIPLHIHLIIIIILCCIIPLVHGQAAGVAVPQDCKQIIPHYSLDNGITFHTATLFDFVSYLPPIAWGSGHDAEIRVLISQAKERCNLQSSSTGGRFTTDIDSTTRAFRAACFSLQRSFSISRGVELDVEMNSAGTVEEAAVLAAISLAYHSLQGDAQCGNVCPCIYENAQPICTVPTTNTGLCAPASQNTTTAAIEGATATTTPPSVVSAEIEDGEPGIDIDVTIPAEEESIAPSSLPTATGTVTPSEDDMTVITITTTTFASPSVTPAVEKEEELPMATTPVGDEIEPGVADSNGARLTPEPLAGITADLGKVPEAENTAGSSSAAKGSRSLSVGAIVGIGIAGFACVALVGGFVATQIAFRRRHADEIEQWRNAFRVVEN